MSKLIVQISKIEKIEDLKNADKLVMATVKGWQCLIGKGQHKVGELVVFIPPDAVIPYNLIEKFHLDYLKGHGRVKTIKLCGYISQGLVLPVEKLFPTSEGFIKEGTDVAKELGITKYEVVVKQSTQQKDTFFNLYKKFINKEVTLRRFIFKTFGLIKNYFKPKKKVNPNFDKYTDIDNIKHYPEVFVDGEEVVISEKIHGSSTRYGFLSLNKTVLGKIKQFFTRKTHEYVVGSHNVQKTIFSGKGYYKEDVYTQIGDRYKLKDIIPKDYIIYGEIYGGKPKIQELDYGLKNSIDVVFFDVKYKGKYLDFQSFRDFCESRSLPIAPICYIGPYSKEILDKYTNAKNTIVKSENGFPVKQIREGCVVKPIIEEYSNRCGRKILKSINPEYLLTKKQDKPEEVIDDNTEFPH